MHDGTEALLAELDRLADRARHPALEIDGFTDDDGEEGDIELRPEQELLVRRRRATVIYAANLVVNECLDDQQRLEWDEDTGLPVVDGDLGDSFVWRFFPPRFRGAYDAVFFRRVLVTAVKVGYDLAREDGGSPACIGEELVINAICQMAERVMDEAGLGRPWSELTEMLLEDLDFEYLFDAEMDGIESDPSTQRDMGMWVPDVSDWFAPFNDAVVHPFAETVATGPEEYDLSRLLRDDADAERQARNPAVVDDPAPITGLAPVSDIVAIARAAESQAPDGTWVADSSAPESSFAAVVEAAKVASSGWLTWEPHEGADIVRTDRVIVFQPHRHFPVGPDQPWAEVAISQVVMYVPLSAVVSFRPGPAGPPRLGGHRQAVVQPGGA